MIQKIFIVLAPLLLVGFLFTNTTSVDPVSTSLLRNIQDIDGLLAQPNISQATVETLKGVKLYYIGRLSRHMGLSSCNSLKAIIPSLESGMYSTYRTSGAETFDLRFCDLTTNQDLEIRTNVSMNLRQEEVSSTYYETFSLSANNTSTPIRKNLPGILQVLKVIPNSPQTPCAISDYGFDSAGFWVKNKCQAQFMVLKAQGTRYLDALENSNVPELKGEITNVVLLEGDQLRVQGWSCEVGNNSQIEVQLYLGDAGVNGIYMASQSTSLAHNAIVGSQCQTSGSAKHNFSFTVDLKVKPTHSADQKAAILDLSHSRENDHIFIYAVSHKENGFSMFRLNGSGVHRYKIGNINGWVDSVVHENNQLVVKGWSCHVDDARSMSVDIYHGNLAGLPGSVLLGRKNANVNHESAVSAICKGGGVAHRYVAQFPLSTSHVPPGSPIYVYGINLVPGRANSLLSGSGTLKTPVADGWVDGATIEMDKLLITGWACIPGASRSLAVNVYMNNSAGLVGATYVGSGQANIMHESAVSAACKTQGVGHRFRIQLPIDTAKMISGKPIYVHGISGLGSLVNPVLKNSGIVKMPALPDKKVLGNIDTAKLFAGLVEVKGWACNLTTTTPTTVQLIKKSATGVETVVASAVASISNETAVNTACKTTGSFHRFKISASAANFKIGEVIYVKAISAVSYAPNSYLAGSGVLRLSP